MRWVGSLFFFLCVFLCVSFDSFFVVKYLDHARGDKLSVCLFVAVLVVLLLSCWLE